MGRDRGVLLARHMFQELNVPFLVSAARQPRQGGTAGKVPYLPGT